MAEKTTAQSAANSANMHMLTAIRLNGSQAAILATLEKRSEKLESALKAAGAATGVDRFALGRKQLDDESGDVLAIAYVHGNGAKESILPNFLSRIAGLSDAEANLFHKLGSVNGSEQIFGWQDDDAVANDPGHRIGMILVASFNDQQADEIRDLVAGLRENHIDGLAERAQTVGYYREAMSLVPDRAGKWFYLVFLDTKASGLMDRIQAYPETEFTRYWSPRYVPLMMSTGAFAPEESSTATEFVLSWSLTD